jgi:hypothetical protein
MKLTFSRNVLTGTRALLHSLFTCPDQQVTFLILRSVALVDNDQFGQYGMKVGSNRRLTMQKITINVIECIYHHQTRVCST